MMKAVTMMRRAGAFVTRGLAPALLATLLAAAGAAAQDQLSEAPSTERNALPFGAPPPPPTGVRFDLDRFEQNLKNAFAGDKAVGYAYAITVDGQLKRSGRGGVARRAADNQNVALDQSPTKRMNIASVTKTITAAAVLKAIQDKKAVGHPDLTVHSKIDPFLPAGWTRGPGVKDLTFRELLSQYSGMNNNGGGTGGDAIQKWIADGVTRPKNDFVYINANFAIFRYVLPYMLASEATRTEWNKLSQSDSNKLNAAVSEAFRTHMRELIFEPMGIKDADLVPTDSVPTLLYHTAHQSKGTVVGTWLTTGGGGGWFLSAVDLAQFLAHLRHNDKILNASTRQTMYDHRLGWRPPKEYSTVRGKHGFYHAHGGALSYSVNVPSPGIETLKNAGPAQKVGMASGIMDYGNGVQAALLINSLGTYGDKIRILRDAFDNAWVAVDIKAP